MSLLALDTSVAVPLLVSTHAAHAAVTRWRDGRPVALSGHAQAETYSVLTRLPGDLRLAPRDAARLMSIRFAPSLLLGAEETSGLVATLAALGVAGGAVYDAMVGLASVQHGAVLATRDARARSTYETVGATVVTAG